MSHIPGHVPNGTLYIRDTLSDNDHHVHGYLHPAIPPRKAGDDYKPDVNFKILFMNNRLLDLPEPIAEGGKYPRIDKLKSSKKIKDRMVGFHLLLIDMPRPEAEKEGPDLWGIAYDLVPWNDHQCTEECVQQIRRYTGKRIEDIEPVELFDLADRVEYGSKDSDTKVILKALKEKELSGSQWVSIIRQSAKYLEGPFFKTVRAGNNSYDWIKNNIVPFENLPRLFGKYEPDAKYLVSLTIQTFK